eukprot:6026485-Prymnesium_polylepis.3
MLHGLAQREGSRKYRHHHIPRRHLAKPRALQRSPMPRSARRGQPGSGRCRTHRAELRHVYPCAPHAALGRRHTTPCQATKVVCACTVSLVTSTEIVRATNSTDDRTSILVRSSTDERTSIHSFSAYDSVRSRSPTAEMMSGMSTSDLPVSSARTTPVSVSTTSHCAKLESSSRCGMRDIEHAPLGSGSVVAACDVQGQVDLALYPVGLAQCDVDLFSGDGGNVIKPRGLDAAFRVVQAE